MMLRSTGGRGYRIGIVNPTTLVGKEILSILRERGFPAEEVRLIDTESAEEAILMEGLDEPTVTRQADEHEFEGVDLVFFCGSAAQTDRWISLREDHGFVAIDLAQPSSRRAHGPESIAGLNAEAIDEDTMLIVSPHPVTTTLALVLSPIVDKFEIDFCTATVVEPASEHDQKGIDEMFAQTVAVLNVQGPPQDVFGRQAAFNLYPPEGGEAIDEYVASQLEIIMKGRIPISLQFLQGATFHSHSISLYLRIDGDILDEELAAILESSPGISVAEMDESFGTLDAGGRDEILVGRIKKDPNIEGGFWLFLIADNLRRSSALNAVLLAEHLIERFGTAPN